MTRSDTAQFEQERPRLIALAYRMLGERSAAEDIIQEAWLLWQQTNISKINSAPAWLTTVVTRLAIDVLRSAKTRRETYIGSWLPEPIIDDQQLGPEDAFSLARECELALLWAMERLSAEERSAFILRKAFDSDYAEIASILGKSEANCRKIVSRAAQQVKAIKPKFNAEPGQTADALARFLQACGSQEHSEVLKLLAADVTALSDGGGKARASLRPLVGNQEVTQVFIAQARKSPETRTYQFTSVNQQPAVLMFEGQQLTTVMTVRLNADGLIDWIYTLRNPQKIRR